MLHENIDVLGAIRYYTSIAFRASPVDLNQGWPGSNSEPRSDGDVVQGEKAPRDATLFALGPIPGKGVETRGALCVGTRKSTTRSSHHLIRASSRVALPSPETREMLDHLRVFDVGMFVEPHFPTEIELDAA